MREKYYAQTVGLRITCALNASMKDAAEFVKRQVTIRGQRIALITRLTRRTSSPSVGKTMFCPISFRPTSKSSGKLSNRLNRLFSTLRPCVVLICTGPNQSCQQIRLQTPKRLETKCCPPTSCLIPVMTSCAASSKQSLRNAKTSVRRSQNPIKTRLALNPRMTIIGDQDWTGEAP